MADAIKIRQPGEDAGVFVSFIELMADNINFPLSVTSAMLVTLILSFSKSIISATNFLPN
jgi:hypothetical protein